MRKNICRFLSVFWLIHMTVLTSCGMPAASLTNPSEVSSNSVAGSCIPPLHSFAYSTSIDEDGQIPGRNFFVEPGTPWAAETEIPDLSATSVIPIYGQGISIVRSREGYVEIWIKLFRLDSQSLEFAHEYAVYQSDAQEWRLISGTVHDNPSIHVVNLFVDDQGTLWGQNFWAQASSDPIQFPFLSRFNDELQIFEQVETTETIPAFQSDEQTNLWIGRHQSKTILDAKRGVFWVLVHADGIYNYDIGSNEIRKFTNLDARIISAGLGEDGSLYYSVVNNSDNQPHQSLRHFSVLDGVKIIPVNLVPLPESPNLLVDNKGNLWLDAAGWKSPNNDWYQIHPSPIFITNKKSSALDALWQMPSIQIESSDGRLWFRSENGMAWLNPDKGEWCWFTTYQSDIVEDADGNLWMIADGKLYKYPLRP
jgi:hypothetical protein